MEPARTAHQRSDETPTPADPPRRWPVRCGLGLKHEVSTYLGEIDAREINSIPIGVGSDGQAIVARVGRYGPYLQRGEDRVSIPDDLAPDELTVEQAESLLEAPSSDRVLGDDPETGLPVQVRPGRFGPYVQLGDWSRAGPSPVPPLCSPPCRRPPSPSSRPSTCSASRGRWHRPVDGGGDRRPQRPVRSLSQEGERHPEPPVRGPDPHRDRRRGPGLVRPAQDPGSQRQGATARDGGGPRHRSAHGGQGRAVRSLRDRRHHQRSLRRGDDVEALTAERASELLADVGRPVPPPGQKSAGQKAAKKTRPRRPRPRRRPPRRRRPKRAGPNGSGHKPAGAEDRQRRVSDRQRGRLVALEGIDGCGKSTQAELLATRFGAVLTFEPGATRAR